MKLYALFWLLLAMPCYGFGEYFAKYYAQTYNIKWGILAVLFYALNATCFLPGIKNWNSLVVFGSIWSISYAVITLFIGFFIFSEQITTYQSIGLVFGFISILLLAT